jgi:hypothetical protein
LSFGCMSPIPDIFFSIHAGFVHVLLIWFPYRFPIHFLFIFAFIWFCFTILVMFFFPCVSQANNFISKSWEGCSFLTGKFLDKRFSQEFSVSRGEWTFCYWVCLPGIYIEYVS